MQKFGIYHAELFVSLFFELRQISAKKFLSFVNSYPYFCLFQIPLQTLPHNKQTDTAVKFYAFHCKSRVKTKS